MSHSRKRHSPSTGVETKADTGPETPSAEPTRAWPEKLIGAKYVRLLEMQLRSLQDENAHGNQKLFLDDVFVVYLLAFFNPTIRSLRTIEDLSQTPHAQRHLSVHKICRSTFSDFNKCIDPERLVPIVQTLRNQLSRRQNGLSPQAYDLQDLLKQTVAVDGTFLHAVADVAWAIANSNNHGVKRHRARLDAHLNVSTWIPEAIVVPDPGESEADSAIRNLQPDKIYLYDRGYSGFALLRAHFGDVESADAVPIVKSHFVVRYKKEGGNSPALSDAVEQPLTEVDIAAGVISDRVGYFSSGSARREGLSKIPLREVIVSYDDNGEKKILRLITSLLNLSAQTIAILYRWRWQVEVYQTDCTSSAGLYQLAA